MTIIDITPSIKNKVLDIRNKTKLRLPDAIIAATAIDQNLPPITADQKLEKIPELDSIIILK